MNVEELLEMMEETLEAGTIVPFSASKRMVDVDRMRDIIDEVRNNLPDEIRESKKIVNDREQIMQNARIESESIIQQAEERARVLTSEQEIVKRSQQHAAEILSAAQLLLTSEKPHGTVKLAFTPDEEIGEGASLFDVKGFACDFAYTVDGEELGELGYETFNAAEAVLTLAGKNIHPGSAKGKMLNCALMAGEFLAAFPESETPAATEGREGFYHIESVRAEVESGEIKLIIRDHDAEKFEARKRFVEGVCAQLKEKYGESAAEVKIRDQYRNCLEKIREHFHLVEGAGL